MKPCKHLDYETIYLGCVLKTIKGFPVLVRYWDRLAGGAVTKEELAGFPKTPTNVQFCKLKGRISGTFQCYNEDEMICYEEEDK